MVQNIIL